MLRKMLGAGCFLIATTASAYTDTSPLTFSVEADSDYPFCCGVYNGPVFVSAAYSDLFIRGMAEFNLLSGLQGYRGESVFLSFAFLGSYSYSSNFVSPVSISAYIGDNLAARPDYGVSTFASVGTFQTTGLAVGDKITYDVTPIFQFATRAGAPALGFRLAIAGNTGGATHSASFGNFSLSPTVPAVPEPSEYALLLSGFAAIGLAFRKKHAQQPAEGAAPATRPVEIAE